MQTRMWARAQRDGRPAEYRWRSRFKAAKFGGRALLVYRGVTLPTRLKPAARSSLQIQDEKNRQETPSGHYHANLSGYIFAIKAHIDNRKKLVRHQYLLHMSPQYGELRPTSG